MHIQKQSLLFFVTSLLVCTLSISTAHAFSVSPSSLDLDAVLVNTQQTRYMTIGIADRYDETHTFALSDTADFLTIPRAVTVEAGQTAVTIPVTVDATGLALGEHGAVVTIFENEKDMEATIAAPGTVSAGLSVIQKASVQVRVQVTDVPVRDVIVKDVIALTAEEGDIQELRIQVLNRGNVVVAPTRFDVSFVHVSDASFNESISIDMSEAQSVLPGETRSVPVSVPIHLLQGQYHAEVAVYAGDSAFGSAISQRFDIVPTGSLSHRGELLRVESTQGSYPAHQRVKLEGVFRNMGTAPVDAQLVVHIFYDNALLDIHKGKVASIDPDHEEQLTDQFFLQRPGTYVLEIYADYEQKRTAKQMVTVEVTESVLIKTFSWVPVIVIALVCLVVLWIVYRKRCVRI